MKTKEKDMPWYGRTTWSKSMVLLWPIALIQFIWHETELTDNAKSAASIAIILFVLALLIYVISYTTN